jgi:hypothetical protein
MTKRCLMTICIAVLAISTALAQENNSLPLQPRQADSGPSLEVTAKFIQDKVAEQGVIKFAVLSQDTVDDTYDDYTDYESFDSTGFSIDVSKCSFRAQSETTIHNPGRKSEDDRDYSYDGRGSLGSIKQLQVVPASTWWTQGGAGTGWTRRIEPPFFVLSLHGPKLTEDKCPDSGKAAVDCRDAGYPDWLALTLAFRDEETASRVAKALVHAVELCGGGGQPEPF